MLFLFFIMFSCQKENKNNLVVVSDDTYANEWTNKVEYDEIQDYLKNLDYSKLEHPDVHPALKEILNIFKDVVDGEELNVIPKIQDILNTRNNPSLNDLYYRLIEELLVESGKYKALLENFPNSVYFKELATILSTFPETKISSLSSKSPKLKALKKSKFNQVLLESKINDQKVMAMFDTGQDYTAISKSFAIKAGVKFNEENQVEITTVTSIKVPAYPVYIDEIILGNVKLNNFYAIVYDDKDITIGEGEHSAKFDCILGWSLIKHLIFTIDTKANIYTANLSKKEVTSFRNIFWCSFPGIKLNSSNGQSLLFGLDTGLGETELKTNSISKMDLGDIKEESVLIGGHGGLETHTLKKTENVTLHMASHKLVFNELFIRENLNFYFLKQDGTIGADIFKNNIITIDYKNGIFDIKL